MKKFGRQAERWVVELLQAHGHRVIPSNEVEDRLYKVDFWVARNGLWLAIQFSVDRKALVAEKGLDALSRGIVPSWLDGQELEAAMNGRPELQPRLVAQFWDQVEKVLVAFPNCRGKKRPVVPGLRSGPYIE